MFQEHFTIVMAILVVYVVLCAAAPWLWAHYWDNDKDVL